MEDLFAGAPAGGTLLVGNNNRQMFWSSNAVFAQDDWRLTPKVIINPGMRWAYESPISCGQQWMGEFRSNHAYWDGPAGYAG